MTTFFSTRTLSRAAAMLVLAGALAACGASAAPANTAVATVAAEPTAAPVVEATAAPTAEPTAAPVVEATAAPTAEPTAEPAASGEPTVFTSASMPVEVTYPGDWTVQDFGERESSTYVDMAERSMAITSPDGDGMFVVRYYDYKGIGSGDQTGAYMALQFNESIDRTSVNESTDTNGDTSAEWTFTDKATNTPMRALLRFVHVEGSPYTYAVMFKASEDAFTELGPTGQAMVDSFQEK